MNDQEEQMGEIIVLQIIKQVQGITTIEPEVIRKIPDQCRYRKYFKNTSWS
jgi:hypothetical protein